MRTCLGQFGDASLGGTQPRWALVCAVFAVAVSAGCGSDAGTASGTNADAGAVDSNNGGDVAVDAVAKDATAGDTSGSDTSGSDAAPTDAADATAKTCTLPEVGSCNGTVLNYCDDTGDQSYDCKDMAVDVAAACTLIDADWGHDCALPVGAECTYETDEGETSWDFCNGAGGACVSGKDSDECENGKGKCAEADIDTCKGDDVVLDCAGSKSWLLDCKSLGGGCSDSEDGAYCDGLPKGAQCDDVYLVCKDPLACVVADGEDVGSCE
jgi:hypothetical protein